LALGLIARGLYYDGVEPFVEESVDCLLQIRPRRIPTCWS
jgi:hypothetical protein